MDQSDSAPTRSKTAHQGRSALRGIATRFTRFFDAAAARVGSPGVPYPAATAFGLTFLLLALGVKTGFNLGDESYLWYGAQRVLAGDVPFRDFQSYYDVGRYYLAAAFMVMQGSHGIVATRIAMAACGALTAGVGAHLLFRKSSRPALWAFLAVVVSLFVWMGPTHKLLDVAASALLVGLLTWLIEQPSALRCFLNGVSLGVLAFVAGRNHGLYGGLADIAALSCVTLVEKRAGFFRSIGCWAAGVFVGYLPMLLALILVRGMWSPFWDSIRIYIVLGATNLPLPVPWPWKIPAGMTLLEQLRYILSGTVLLLQPLFGVAVAGYFLWHAWRNKRALPPVIFAAALLAIVYTHHAFARAGLGHLRQAIIPFLICAFALALTLSRGTKMLLMAFICAASLFILLPLQPLYQRASGQWVAEKIGEDTLQVRKGEGSYIATLTNLINKYTPGGEEFVAVPYLPGLYAIFDRHAGLWSSYELSPALDSEQARDIERLATRHPAFVMIENATRDNRPDLAYPNADAQVYQYIVAHYTRVYDRNLGDRMQLYVRPESPDASPRFPGSP